MVPLPVIATVDRSYYKYIQFTIILFVDDALVASILSHYTYTHILKPIDMVCPDLSYIPSSVTIPLNERLFFTIFRLFRLILLYLIEK